MSADVKAIRLLDRNTWWGDAAVIGNGTIQIGESVVDAAKAIGIYEVDTVRKELGYMTANGKFKPVGDYRLILENTPWLPEGEIQEISRTVSNYEPLQNRTFFDMVDQLTSYLQLEGIGMLGKSGEFTFVQFKLGEFAVGGHDNELLNEWLVFDDDKFGNGFRTGKVDTRIVCANTRRRAIRDLEPLPHTNDMGVYLRYIVEAYHATLEQQKQEHAMMNALFAHKLDKGDVNRGIKAVLPNVTKPRNLSNLEKIIGFDSATVVGKETVVTDDEEIQVLVDKEVTRYQTDLARNEERRSAIADAFFRFNDEYSYAANTAWAFFNAVTYVSTHGDEIKKSNGKKLFHKDSSGLSMLNGERARLNERAWDYVTGLLG